MDIPVTREVIKTGPEKAREEKQVKTFCGSWL